MFHYIYIYYIILYMYNHVDVGRPKIECSWMLKLCWGQADSWPGHGANLSRAAAELRSLAAMDWGTWRKIHKLHRIRMDEGTPGQIDRFVVLMFAVVLCISVPVTKD